MGPGAGRPGAGLDLMHARRQVPFARHAHAEYAIGVCLDGQERIDIAGSVHLAGPGSVVVIEPERVHDGAPATCRASATGCSTRARASCWPWPGSSNGRTSAARCSTTRELAAELAAVHRLLGAGGDPLEADTLLVAGLGRLVARHAEPSLRAEPQHRHLVARQVMERLADQLLCPPTLAALATELELSRYQLVRRFAAEVGMPPYGWLAQHRVARARGLLDRGLPLGEVAAAVGFADQAHLTRWFRRVLGVTPGAYRNSVQDATALIAHPLPRSRGSDVSGRGWVLFAVMSLVWGISYLFIKVALQSLPVSVMVFVRSAGAALVLLPFVARAGWGRRRGRCARTGRG